MLRVIIFLSLFFAPFFAFAQSAWFPVGAKWYYRLGDTSNTSFTFNKVEIIDSAVVNGKKCKELSWDTPLGCTGIGAGKYVYSDSNEVYFYSPALDSFLLLYDLDAQVGDTWAIPIIQQDMHLGDIVFHVDSVGISVINIGIASLSVKTIYIHDTTTTNLIHSARPVKVLQFVGSLESFFPWHILSCSMRSSPLRCFELPNMGLYKTESFTGPCDSSFNWTSVQQTSLSPNTSVSIYPQPANHQLSIKLKSNQQSGNFKCTIYNLQGKKIQTLYSNSTSSQTHSFEVNVSPLLRGVYFYRISAKQSKDITGKFVVQ